MSFTTTTPYMDLVLPVPTQEFGPAWAEELNVALGLVDSHDHTPGQGVPIPIAAVLINSDLDMLNFNIIDIRATRFTNQTSPLSTPSDVTEMYVVNGNLYYNNQLGQQVQITAGSALNAGSIGGIGGDYISSGALVYYDSLSNSYAFTSAGNLYANMLQGATTIFPTGTNSFGVTLQASGTISSNYAITFADTLPGSQSVVEISPAGVISYVAPTFFVPTGVVLEYGGNSAPAGYLLCDGTSYLQSAFPTLFAVIGNSFGAVDGTHFNVPDRRGNFGRGVTGSSPNDPDVSSRTVPTGSTNTPNAPGSTQTDAMTQHTHNRTGFNDTGTAGALMRGSLGNAGATGNSNDNGIGTISGVTAISTETRPINVYFNYIIKT